jgi:hypothetical protein
MPRFPLGRGAGAVARALLFSHALECGAPAFDGGEQLLVVAIVQLELGARDRPHPSHEGIEHAQVEARVLVAGKGYEFVELKAPGQLLESDEVAKLGTSEDRQDLVGAELA